MGVEGLGVYYVDESRLFERIDESIRDRLLCAGPLNVRVPYGISLSARSGTSVEIDEVKLNYKQTTLDDLQRRASGVALPSAPKVENRDSSNGLPSKNATQPPAGSRSSRSTAEGWLEEQTWLEFRDTAEDLNGKRNGNGEEQDTRFCHKRVRENERQPIMCLYFFSCDSMESYKSHRRAQLRRFGEILASQKAISNRHQEARNSVSVVGFGSNSGSGSGTGSGLVGGLGGATGSSQGAQTAWADTSDLAQGGGGGGGSGGIGLNGIDSGVGGPGDGRGVERPRMEGLAVLVYAAGDSGWARGSSVDGERGSHDRAAKHPVSSQGQKKLFERISADLDSVAPALNGRLVRLPLFPHEWPLPSSSSQPSSSFHTLGHGAGTGNSRRGEGSSDDAAVADFFNAVNGIIARQISLNLANEYRNCALQQQGQNGNRAKYTAVFDAAEELVFFLLKVSMANEALNVYDNLDLLSADNMTTSNRFRALFHSCGLPNFGDEPILTQIDRYTEELRNDQITYVDFRQYLFARQCQILKLLKVPKVLLARALSFLYSFANELIDFASASAKDRPRRQMASLAFIFLLAQFFLRQLPPLVPHAEVQDLTAHPSFSLASLASLDKDSTEGVEVSGGSGSHRSSLSGAIESSGIGSSSMSSGSSRSHTERATASARTSRQGPSTVSFNMLSGSMAERDKSAAGPAAQTRRESGLSQRPAMPPDEGEASCSPLALIQCLACIRHFGVRILRRLSELRDANPLLIQRLCQSSSHLPSPALTRAGNPALVDGVPRPHGKLTGRDLQKIVASDTAFSRLLMHELQAAHRLVTAAGLRRHAIVSALQWPPSSAADPSLPPLTPEGSMADFVPGPATTSTPSSVADGGPRLTNSLLASLVAERRELLLSLATTPSSFDPPSHTLCGRSSRALSPSQNIMRFMASTSEVGAEEVSEIVLEVVSEISKGKDVVPKAIDGAIAVETVDQSRTAAVSKTNAHTRDPGTLVSNQIHELIALARGAPTRRPKIDPADLARTSEGKDNPGIKSSPGFVAPAFPLLTISCLVLEGTDAPMNDTTDAVLPRNKCFAIARVSKPLLEVDLDTASVRLRQQLTRNFFRKAVKDPSLFQERGRGLEVVPLLTPTQCTSAKEYLIPCGQKLRLQISVKNKSKVRPFAIDKIFVELEMLQSSDYRSSLQVSSRNPKDPTLRVWLVHIPDFSDQSDTLLLTGNRSDVVDQFHDVNRASAVDHGRLRPLESQTFELEYIPDRSGIFLINNIYVVPQNALNDSSTAHDVTDFVLQASGEELVLQTLMSSGSDPSGSDDASSPRLARIDGAPISTSSHMASQIASQRRLHRLLQQMELSRLPRNGLATQAALAFRVDEIQSAVRVRLSSFTENPFLHNIAKNFPALENDPDEGGLETGTIELHVSPASVAWVRVDILVGPNGLECSGPVRLFLRESESLSMPASQSEYESEYGADARRGAASGRGSAQLSVVHSHACALVIDGKSYCKEIGRRSPQLPAETRCLLSGRDGLWLTLPLFKRRITLAVPLFYDRLKSRIPPTAEKGRTESAGTARLYPNALSSRGLRDSDLRNDSEISRPKISRHPAWAQSGHRAGDATLRSHLAVPSMYESASGLASGDAFSGGIDEAGRRGSVRRGMETTRAGDYTGLESAVPRMSLTAALLTPQASRTATLECLAEARRPTARAGGGKLRGTFASRHGRLTGEPPNIGDDNSPATVLLPKEAQSPSVRRRSDLLLAEYLQARTAAFGGEEGEGAADNGENGGGDREPGLARQPFGEEGRGTVPGRLTGLKAQSAWWPALDPSPKAPEPLTVALSLRARIALRRIPDEVSDCPLDSPFGAMEGVPAALVQRSGSGGQSGAASSLPTPHTSNTHGDTHTRKPPRERTHAFAEKRDRSERVKADIAANRLPDDADGPGPLRLDKWSQEVATVEGEVHLALPHYSPLNVAATQVIDKRCEVLCRCVELVACDLTPVAECESYRIDALRFVPNANVPFGTAGERVWHIHNLSLRVYKPPQSSSPPPPVSLMTQSNTIHSNEMQKKVDEINDNTLDGEGFEGEGTEMAPHFTELIVAPKSLATKPARSTDDGVFRLADVRPIQFGALITRYVNAQQQRVNKLEGQDNEIEEGEEGERSLRSGHGRTSQPALALNPLEHPSYRATVHFDLFSSRGGTRLQRKLARVARGIPRPLGQSFSVHSEPFPLSVSTLQFLDHPILKLKPTRVAVTVTNHTSTPVRLVFHVISSFDAPNPDAPTGPTASPPSLLSTALAQVPNFSAAMYMWQVCGWKRRTIELAEFAQRELRVCLLPLAAGLLPAPKVALQAFGPRSKTGKNFASFDLPLRINGNEMLLTQTFSIPVEASDILKPISQPIPTSFITV